MRKLALPIVVLVIALVVFLLTRGQETDRAKLIEQDAREAQAAPAVGELAPPEAEAAVQAASVRIEQALEVAAEVVDAPSDPQLARLVVTVVDREGWKPLAARPVFVDRDESIAHELFAAGGVGGIGRGVLTDALGIARFDLEPGEKLRVFPRHDDFVPTAGVPIAQLGSTAFSVKPLEAGEVREQEIHMSTITGELHLLIVDEVSERQIAGAEVRHGGRKISVSDESGRAIYDLGYDTYFALDVRAGGYGPAVIPLFDRRETADAPFIVRLRRGATVRGRVKGLEDPASLWVKLEASGYELAQPAGILGLNVNTPDQARTVKLDFDGNFELSDLPTKVSIEAQLQTARGKWTPLQSDPLFLEPGEVRTVEWKQASNGALRGRVVDERGQPLAGKSLGLQLGISAVLFRLESRNFLDRTTTDELGRFAFEEMRAGDYVIGVLAEDVEEADTATGTAVVAVTLAAGETVEDLELVVSDAVYLTGTMLDPEGVPVGGVPILVYSIEKGMVQGKPDATGAFRLGPLASGTYTVMVRAAQIVGASPPPDREVELPCEPIEIRLAPGSLLAGRIVDASTGAEVLAQTSVQQPFGEALRQTVGSSGRNEFSYGGLTAGTYHLIANEVGGRYGILSDVELAVGESLEDLEIPMGPAGSLDVVYQGERKELSLRVRVGTVALTNDPLAPGAHALLRAPVGAVEVELILHDWEVPAAQQEVLDHRTVQVIANETIEVVFD